MKNLKPQLKHVVLLTTLALLFAIMFLIVDFENGKIPEKLEEMNQTAYQDKRIDLYEAIELAGEKYDIPVGLLKGIANAESSLGTQFVGCDFSYNVFGVTPAGQEAEPCNPHLRRYDSWEEASEDTARIVRLYYFDLGLDTPEKMVKKYVGYYNPHWIRNVKEYYN